MSVKVYVNSMRILATAALVAERFYFGPIGAGAGLVDGLILYCIWRQGLKE